MRAGPRGSVPVAERDEVGGQLLEHGVEVAHRGLELPQVAQAQPAVLQEGRVAGLLQDFPGGGSEKLTADFIVARKEEDLALHSSVSEVAVSAVQGLKRLDEGFERRWPSRLTSKSMGAKAGSKQTSSSRSKYSDQVCIQSCASTSVVSKQRHQAFWRPSSKGECTCDSILDPPV